MDFDEFDKPTAITKFIERCLVTAVPAGAAPKDVTIKLPDQDGATVPARYMGFPPSLAVNDEVSARATPQDPIRYMIAGPSGATGVASGWPFENVLTVSTTNTNANYDDIQDAIDAASQNDLILLDAETFTLTAMITIDKQITLAGWGPEATIIYFDGADHTILLDVSTENDDVAIIDLAVTNESSTTAKACITMAAGRSSKLTMRNVYLEKWSDAALGYGLWQTGGANWVLDNIKILSYGATTAYGYFADTAASSAKIFGGEYIYGDTADIKLNHASANVRLIDQTLYHDTLTVTLGTATGRYYDLDGNLRLTPGILKQIDIDIAIPKRPAANPPAESTEDGFPTLDFDDTQEESIYMEFHLPHDYKGAGTIHIHFDFFVDTAPAGAANAGWGVEYKQISHGDNFDFGAGTSTVEAATAITTGTPANDKKIHEITALALTTTSFVAGDTIYTRIYRNVGVASDFTGDVRVIGKVHIEYLADRLGEDV